MGRSYATPLGTVYEEATRAWAAAPAFTLAETFVPLAYARPNGDITDGSWLNEAGSNINLYASIDEAAADDADYIKSSTLAHGDADDSCEVALQSATDPAGNTAHKVAYRYRKSNQAGDPAMDLTVKLVQGTTVIATWTHADIGTGWTTATQTLSAGEADSITDYSNLRLRFTAHAQ